MSNPKTSFSLIILTIVMLHSIVNTQNIFVSIDTDRNLPGTSIDDFTLSGIVGVPNDFYFYATGKDAKYSTFSFEDKSASSGYTSSIIPIITSTKVLIRLSLNPLIPVFVNGQLLLEIRVNNTQNGNSLFFQIKEIQDVALLSCLNDVILLKVSANRNENHLAVFGYEHKPDCNFKIVLDNTSTISIPMSACGIEYDEEFLLRFIKIVNFEGVDTDLNVRLTCKRMIDTFILTNNDVLSKYKQVTDNITYEQDLQVIMYLHERNNQSAVITQGIEVKKEVSLKIEVDSLYVNDFDVIPLVCTANDILILGKSNQQSLNKDMSTDQLTDVGCAHEPFANFTKIANGQYRSDFSMFRTVRSGISDSYVNFVCLMYVCKIDNCPILPCIKTQ